MVEALNDGAAMERKELLIQRGVSRWKWIVSKLEVVKEDHWEELRHRKLLYSLRGIRIVCSDGL